ncbi:MAG: site-specific DNA-methyltransferase [Bacilli bacterium]|nr:site-specific DNA-methyltransferase [Bacilli bacterium]
MNKLSMCSKDIINLKINEFEKLFPNCVINGKIDFDVLKQEFSECIIDEKKEKYELTWPGKKQSIVACNSKTTNTLIPKNNINNNTKNLYIEGDNLEVLKILQESYLNKVDCIYIDPPYNTGNDFIYNDNFNTSTSDELTNSGQIDEDGNRLVSNLISNGRFHSDWLSMMYPRLKLARNLLSERGVIYISIDDHEYANLKRLCDEIFGEQNFLATIVWERAYSPINLKKHFSESHDFALCYAKKIENAINNGLKRNNDANDRYSNPDNDPRGNWSSSDLSVGPAIQSNIYEITTPSGRKVLPPSGYSWRLNQDTFNEYVKDNRIWFGPTGDNVPRIKRFLSEVKQTITPMTIWKYEDVGHSQSASQNLKKLFDGKAVFDYPKPVEYIKRMVSLYTNKDSLILDFFSGSATTAHAVMQLNAEDGGNRKYIMVQIPEKCSEKSEAYKEGYSTICEVAKERIRRAAKKIQEETNANIDYGFRVYKVDSSNMKDIFYKPIELGQMDLMEYLSNIKEERTPEDILTQVMLDLGLTLDLNIEERKILSNKVFYVENNSLIACFDDQIDINIIDEICKCNPMKVVFKDISFKTDKDKINLEERIKKLSPDTEISIL